MERRPDPATPAALWLCAAVVFHLTTYRGAETLADVGYGKLELRQFAAAVRDVVHPPENAMEVTFVDPMAPEPALPEPAPTTPPPPVKQVELKKPDAKKPEPKKDEPKKPEPPRPEPKKLDLLKPPVVKPPEPPPLPPPDQRVAIRQHVEKDQKDNPDARHIADDANKVKEETQARITARDQDDPKPTPGSNHSPVQRDIGNAEKTHVAESEERPGDDRHPPGERSPTVSPLPAAPPRAEPPKPADPKPVATTPRAGQDAPRPGPRTPAPPTPAPTAAPAPPAPTAQKPAAAPNTQQDDKGSYVVNPFATGADAKPADSATAAKPSPTTPPYVLPKLGGVPGPKGVNFNLTPGSAIAAIGVDALRRERDLDGQRRKTAHRGSWKNPSFEKWRPAIENYVASVKPGNTTSLNAARSPFASYLNAIHNRVHPIFAEDFLWSLDELPKDHPLNRKLATSLEVVVDGERGRIVRMGITRTSGVTAFDVAALDAMERASGRGFGKPPEAILSPDGNVYLHWEFHRALEVACSTQNARPYILKGAPGGPAPGPGKSPPSLPEGPTERGKAGQAPAPRPGKTG